ncbi:hypothetical protein M3Y96_00776400 [Aphelenchoides besseyi]|nr:hypothetical protein M3Y96_00776400 [Aphelenchoides besseyi]
MYNCWTKLRYPVGSIKFSLLFLTTVLAFAVILSLHLPVNQKFGARDPHLEPISPLDLNTPLPRPKECFKNVTSMLNKLRSTQHQKLQDWSKLRNIPKEMKWTGIIAIYNPELINLGRIAFRFSSGGEQKGFVDFVERNVSECNIWTLGIGLDFAGETRLFNRYPQCKFTAVDPVVQINRDIVERVPNARFLKATIGAENGFFLARIRGHDKAYHTQEANHSGFTSFIQRHNGERLIDLINIDIESAEYGVLTKLITDKSKLPIVCQINVELHWPLEKYGLKTDYAFQSVFNFLSNNTFTILNIDSSRHLLRVFMVNTADEQCLKKFFC